MCQTAHAENPIMDKGLVFLKEEEILLTGDNWILTTDVDIAAYHVILDSFEGILDQITEIDLALGKNMIIEMKNQLDQIVSKEITILKADTIKIKQKLNNLVKTVAPYKSDRVKRGLINAGGNVLKWLFGTADNNDLLEVNNKISNLQSKSEGIMNLMNEQVTIIKNLDNNNKKINNNFEKFKIVIQSLQTRIEGITKSDISYKAIINKEIIETLSLNSALRTSEYLLNDIKESVSDLTNALEATALHKLSPHFISPTLLLDALKLVQNHLPNGLSLITSNFDKNLFIYYDIAIVKSVYFNNTLRLFAEIPLKAPGRYFNVYRALPLPYHTNKENTKLYIDSQETYLAVSEDGQYYIEFNIADLLLCKKGFITICPPFKPIRRITDISCLTSLYTGNTEEASKHCSHKITRDNRSILFRAKNTNTWIYSVDRDTLTYNCPSDSESKYFNTTRKVIQGTGILNIPASCIVHNQNYVLLPHTTTTTKFASKLYDIIIPPLDINITNISNFSQKSGTNDEIQEIINSIDVENFKNGIDINVWGQHIKDLRNSKSHNQIKLISFSTITLITFVLFVTFIAYKFKKILCFKINSRTVYNRQVPVNDIELPIHVPSSSQPKVNQLAIEDSTSKISVCKENPIVVKPKRYPIY